MSSVASLQVCVRGVCHACCVAALICSHGHQKNKQEVRRRRPRRICGRGVTLVNLSWVWCIRQLVCSNISSASLWCRTVPGWSHCMLMSSLCSLPLMPGWKLSVLVFFYLVTFCTFSCVFFMMLTNFGQMALKIDSLNLNWILLLNRLNKIQIYLSQFNYDQAKKSSKSTSPKPQTAKKTAKLWFKKDTRKRKK